MKVIEASCDWKNAEDLIRELVKKLPSLGVFAWEPDTGGDSFHIIVTDEKPKDDVICEIEDYFAEYGTLDGFGESEKKMKLYKGTVEVDMVVLAKDEEDAKGKMLENFIEEYENSGEGRVRPQIVESVEELPYAWADAIPWGYDEWDKRTCEKILEENH
jgi:hypothetical protein